jgi:hypothetical protein
MLLSNVHAQESVSDPTGLFYGLSRLRERIDLAFTFDEKARAEKKLRYADKRVAEIELLLDKGNTEKAAEIQDDYETLLDDVDRDIKKAQVEGKDVELLQKKTEQTLQRHEIKLKEKTKTYPTVRRALKAAEETRKSTKIEVKPIVEEKPQPPRIPVEVEKPKPKPVEEQPSLEEYRLKEAEEKKVREIAELKIKQTEDKPVTVELEKPRIQNFTAKAQLTPMKSR